MCDMNEFIETWTEDEVAVWNAYRLRYYRMYNKVLARHADDIISIINIINKIGVHDSIKVINHYFKQEKAEEITSGHSLGYLSYYILHYYDECMNSG